MGQRARGGAGAGRTGGGDAEREAAAEDAAEGGGVGALRGLLDELLEQAQVADGERGLCGGVEQAAVALEGDDALVLDAVALGGAVLAAEHALFAADAGGDGEGLQRGRRRGVVGAIDGGSGVLFEEGAELGGGDLWVEAGGDPEEVERVVGGVVGGQAGGGLVAVVERLVALCGRAGGGGDGPESRLVGEVGVDAEGAGRRRATAQVLEGLDLALDLIL